MVCPFCGGELIVIGVLGYLRHMQCRQCGLRLHQKEEVIASLIDPIEMMVEQGRGEFVSTVDELTCDGDHQTHEDCMICTVCGTCTESLNEEDICTECLEPEDVEKFRNLLLNAEIALNEAIGIMKEGGEVWSYDSILSVKTVLLLQRTLGDAIDKIDEGDYD